MPKTPEQILYHKLYKRFQKALTDFSMLSDGDRILIGLSGGKDSLCLLEMLAQRQRIYKPRIEVEAVHVRMANVSYESDTSYLESFAKEHGVKLHIVHSTIPLLLINLFASFVRGTDARRCSALRRTTALTR